MIKKFDGVANFNHDDQIEKKHENLFNKECDVWYGYT